MAKEKKLETLDAVPSENAAPSPAVEQPKKSDTVEINAEVLKNLIEKVNSIEKKTNEIEQTASQDQIRKIEALRASGKLVKSVKIRRFEGQLVLGWKVIEDRVWVADGKLNEIQTIEVFMEDGTKKPTTLLQFGRACLYEPYEVVKEARTDVGSIELTVLLNDGKQLVIDSRYVN